MDIFQAKMMSYEKPIEQALAYLGYQPTYKSWTKKIGVTWLVASVVNRTEYRFEQFFRNHTEPTKIECYTRKSIPLTQKGANLEVNDLIWYLIDLENYQIKMGLGCHPMDEI